MTEEFDRHIQKKLEDIEAQTEVAGSRYYDGPDSGFTFGVVSACKKFREILNESDRTHAALHTGLHAILSKMSCEDHPKYSAHYSGFEVACNGIHKWIADYTGVYDHLSASGNYLNNTTIYKYPLVICTGQSLKLPKWSKIISVKAQGDKLCLWAETDPDVVYSADTYWITILGTGQGLYTDRGDFIGTCVLPGSEEVWHVYAAKRPA